MSGFTKLSSSIVHSTVWREPHTTRIVWITLLALADPEGYVGASVPGLADAARVTLTECETALASFLAPDPYSRTKDHDGRRIEVAEGGWRLLNHALYRMGRDSEARRLQNREAKRRSRQRGPQSAADVLTDADANDKSASQPPSAQAEAEAEADQDPPLIPPEGGTPTKARKRKPNATTRPEDWKPTKAHQDHAALHGLDVELEASAFRSHHDSKGSVFVSWEAAFSTWLSNQVRWNKQRGTGGPVVQRGGRIRTGQTGWLDEPGDPS